MQGKAPVTLGVAVLLSFALIACDGLDRDVSATAPKAIVFVNSSADSTSQSLAGKFEGRFAEGLNVSNTAEPRDPGDDDVPPLDATGEPVDY